MKPVSSDRERQPKPSCIVLGGGGFIGTNLCRRLVSAGHRVRAFGRRCQFPQELRGAEWYQGDFTDATALAAALETFDVVFHLVHSTTPQSANLDMAGDIQGMVVQNPMRMGYLGVKTMVAHLRGQPIEKRIDTGVTMVTPENLAQPTIQALVNPPTGSST